MENDTSALERYLILRFNEYIQSTTLESPTSRPVDTGDDVQRAAREFREYATQQANPDEHITPKRMAELIKEFEQRGNQ